MARPKNVIRSIEKSISLPEDVVGRVELELWSDVEGRVPFGKWSELVTGLLDGWLGDKSLGKQIVLEHRRYKEALNKIASWEEGDEVGASFDEPAAASTARKALGGKE